MSTATLAINSTLVLPNNSSQIQVNINLTPKNRAELDPINLQRSMADNEVVLLRCSWAYGRTYGEITCIMDSTISDDRFYQIRMIEEALNFAQAPGMISVDHTTNLWFMRNINHFNTLAIILARLNGLELIFSCCCSSSFKTQNERNIIWSASSIFQVTFVSTEPQPPEVLHVLKFGEITYNLYSHSLLHFGQHEGNRKGPKSRSKHEGPKTPDPKKACT